MTSAAQSSGGLVYVLVACLDFFGKRQADFAACVSVFIFLFSCIE